MKDLSLLTFLPVFPPLSPSLSLSLSSPSDILPFKETSTFSKAGEKIKKLTEKELAKKPTAQEKAVFSPAHILFMGLTNSTAQKEVTFSKALEKKYTYIYTLYIWPRINRGGVVRGQAP